MDGATATLWVLAILGGLGLIKKLILLGLPDLKEVIDRVLTFAEWCRDRWRRFNEHTTSFPSTSEDVRQ
jgi:hypothetical protein